MSSSPIISESPDVGMDNTAARAALSQDEIDMLLGFTGPTAPVQSPSATLTDSVSVGFGIDRTDGMIELHLGGSYTLLSPTDAYWLAGILFESAQDAQRRKVAA